MITQNPNNNSLVESNLIRETEPVALPSKQYYSTGGVIPEKIQDNRPKRLGLE